MHVSAPMVVLAGLLIGPSAHQVLAQTMLRRVGPAGEASASLGQPRSIAVGDRDHIYIGDEAPARVLSFDASGRQLRVIGRDGRGPGEFASPNVGASHTLFVNDAQLRRLSAFTPEGRLLWTKPGACCLTRPIRVTTDGKVYVVAAPVVLGGGPEEVDLVVFRSDGTPLDTLPSPGMGSTNASQWNMATEQGAASIPIPFTPRNYLTISHTGTMIWGHSAKYELSEGPDIGAVHRRFARPWSPTPLPVATRDSARATIIDEYARFFDRAALGRTFRLTDIPARAPAFFGLDVDGCGRIWVLRSIPPMPGPVTFDLLSQTGHLIASAAVNDQLFLPGPLWAVGQDRLAAVVADPDGAPMLGVYSLADLPKCADLPYVPPNPQMQTDGRAAARPGRS